MRPRSGALRWSCARRPGPSCVSRRPALIVRLPGLTACPPPLHLLPSPPPLKAGHAGLYFITFPLGGGSTPPPPPDQKTKGRWWAVHFSIGPTLCHVCCLIPWALSCMMVMSWVKEADWGRRALTTPFRMRRAQCTAQATPLSKQRWALVPSVSGPLPVLWTGGMTAALTSGGRPAGPAARFGPFCRDKTSRPSGPPSSLMGGGGDAWWSNLQKCSR